MGTWSDLVRRICVALVTLSMIGASWAPAGHINHRSKDGALASADSAGQAAAPAAAKTTKAHTRRASSAKARTSATKAGLKRATKHVARQRPTPVTAAPKPADRAATATPSTPTSPSAASRKTTTNSAPKTATVDMSLTGASLGIAMPAAPLMWMSDSDRNRDLDRLAATGVRWMRIDVYLDQLTWVNPGQIEWTPLDKTVDEARQRHLEIVGLLGTLPGYGRPAGAPNTYGPTTPDQRQLFAEFSAKAAQRYKGRINTWEVWNEPNVDQGWYPTPNVVDYGKLLTATHNAIKSVSPQATVLTGGTGGKGSELDIEPTRWITSMYQTGLAGSFDGVAMHAYTAPENNNLGEFEVLSVYREIMDRYNPSTLLWITEAGTQVGRSANGTEQVAATNVPAIVDRWKNIHHHGPMLFFTLNDSVEAGFGFYRNDGSARPALGQLAKVSSERP